MFTLTLRTPSSIPLEVDGVTPDKICDLSELEVARLLLLHGNRREELGQLFEVKKHNSADLVFSGDLRNVHGIGRQMTRGRIVCESSVGRHAGARMSGGSLVLEGGAGDWLAAEMRGGCVTAKGAVGQCAGAAYRGARRGMTGGTIWLRSSVGDELGLLMRRGIIVVEGDCGAFAGASMIAGTLVLLGGVGGRLGAGMKRGTILTTNAGKPSSGFRESCEYQPTVLPLLRTAVQNIGCEMLTFHPSPMVHCYRGDVLTGGRGELWIMNSVN